MKLIAKIFAKVAPLGLCAFAVSLSCVCSAIPADAVPAANPKQLNLTISPKQNQSFPNLIKEAEALAKDSIQQSFQSGNGITDIAVYVLGERNGQRVPLISAIVSQSSWQRNPQIKSWIRYFSTAEVLLGFVENVQVARSTADPLIARRSLYPNENEPNFYR